MPNISPDKEAGIGKWSTYDFINAMKRGIAPGATHLYPAFPYTSYQRMTYEDLIDLKAYLDTLPAVRSEVPAHELRFPYNIRRGLGIFQRLHVDGETFTPDPQASDEINRGAYLVLGPGHCAECHSSRDFLGGIIKDKAFAGARNPEGEGRVPNITPSDDGIGDWAEEDIAYLLETGSTPDFDTIGENMVPVQETWQGSHRRTARRSPPSSSRCRRVPMPCQNRKSPPAATRRCLLDSVGWRCRSSPRSFDVKCFPSGEIRKCRPDPAPAPQRIC